MTGYPEVIPVRTPPVDCDSAGREWRFVRLDLATRKYDDVGVLGSAALSVSRDSPGSTFTTYSIPGALWLSIWNCASAANLFRVLPGPIIITDAAVLGDGGRIALAITGDGRGTRIAVVTPLGTEMVDIQKIDAVTRADRKSILASGSIGGMQGIWRIPADWGTPQRLTIKETGITEVRLSEDGTRLAYTKSSKRAPVVRAYQVNGAGRKIKM